MRPETPAWGRGASCAFRMPEEGFYTRAVLMLGICPDCLRSEPRL